MLSLARLAAVKFFLAVFNLEQLISDLILIDHDFLENQLLKVLFK